MRWGDSACHGVALRASTQNCTSNRENCTTRIKKVLANGLLVLRTHRRNEVAHRCRTVKRSFVGGQPAIRFDFVLAGLLLVLAHTCNQTGAGQNPATRIEFVLANLLLAQPRSHRLRKKTNKIKILLDGRMVKNLLSTWRKLRLAALLLVVVKSRCTCGGKDE